MASSIQMAEWIQQLSPLSASVTEDDLKLIDALTRRHDMKTIQSLCAQYTKLSTGEFLS